MADRKSTQAQPAERSEGVSSAFRRVDETTFWGYVYWGDTPDVRFVVEILLDGEPVALLRAEQFDRSLREQGYGDGCHAFTFVARKHQLSGSRVLQARLANLGNPVGPPIDLAMTVSEPRPQRTGSVEWIGGLRLIGTVYSRAGAVHAPSIQVFENDVVVTEVRPRRWSSKRSADDSVDALHFDLHLPADYADGCVHKLRVRDDAERELDGSPLTIQAFEDGLRRYIEDSPALAPEQARAAWFDTFLPMSIPFKSYAEWQQRYAREPAHLERPLPVRVVLIGEDGIEDAIARLTAQSYDGWSAAAVPSADGTTFGWDDLKEALFAEAGEEPIAVFARASTILHRDALAGLVAALSTNADAIAAYCDLELSGDDGSVRPVFFGAFDYERMLEQGYAGHVFAVRIANLIIPDDEERGSLARLLLALFDDAAATPSAQICHVPGALVRIAAGAAAAGSEALRAATTAHLRKRGVAADVLPAAGGLMPAVRVRRRPEKDGLVSVVIPTRDRVELLSACIASIRSKTSTVNYELIIVDNGSVSADTKEFLEKCRRGGDRIVSVPGPFNYSHLNNRGVAAARGEFVCLLNNDTEVLDADWLVELVSRLAEPDAGAVAPMLLWPNKVIQHAGIVLGPNFAASDAFNDCMEGDAGYGDLLRVAHEASAVTAACLLVRRQDYLAVSGFDESAFPVLFNDVDFCLRLRAAGKRVIVTPHARLIHHESATRKNDLARDRAGRFKRELGELRNRWGEVLADDPAYSPFLNLDPYPFSALAWPPRPSAPRLGGVIARARQPAF
jgi:O-antigen biosynthesis protein